MKNLRSNAKTKSNAKITFWHQIGDSNAKNVNLFSAIMGILTPKLNFRAFGIGAPNRMQKQSFQQGPKNMFWHQDIQQKTGPEESNAKK